MSLDSSNFYASAISQIVSSSLSQQKRTNNNTRVLACDVGVCVYLSNTKQKDKQSNIELCMKCYVRHIRANVVVVVGIMANTFICLRPDKLRRKRENIVIKWYQC